MKDLDTLIERLTELREEHGNENVYIDMGLGALCEIEDVDLGGSDEGIVIWPG